MQIVRTIQELRDAVRTQRQAAGVGASVGFAPTMGFLHAGHASLFRAAAANNHVAVASVFVNPTQFGPNEDLARYPRDPDGDTRLAQAAGIDVLWMPDVETMYPPGHVTRVRVTGVSEGLCGASRPHHFEGVTTVVAKLFGAVAPDRAYFGQKDYQQLAVIRRMARDLDMAVEIVGCPTVREPDGLALSSRNVYLAPDERQTARALSRGLQQVQALWNGGNREASVLRAALLASIDDTAIRVDYAEVVDPIDLRRPDDDRFTQDEAVALVAVWVGKTRLIDNHELHRPWEQATPA